MRATARGAIPNRALARPLPRRRRDGRTGPASALTVPGAPCGGLGFRGHGPTCGRRAFPARQHGGIFQRAVPLPRRRILHAGLQLPAVKRGRLPCRGRDANRGRHRALSWAHQRAYSTMLVVYKERPIAAPTFQNRDFSGGPGGRAPHKNGAHFGHTRLRGKKGRNGQFRPVFGAKSGGGAAAAALWFGLGMAAAHAAAGHVAAAAMRAKRSARPAAEESRNILSAAMRSQSNMAFRVTTLRQLRCHLRFFGPRPRALAAALLSFLVLAFSRAPPGSSRCPPRS